MARIPVIGQIRIDFDPALVQVDGKDLRTTLSAVVQVGDSLFLAGDETARIERVDRLGQRHYGQHVAFDLADLVGLPAPAKKEVDIEGLAFDGEYLWVVGSHSGKRSAPKDGDSPEKALERLAKVEFEGNRFLLARIPVAFDGTTPRLEREVAAGGGSRTAAKLRSSPTSSELVERLTADAHLKPFLQVPGKDNGFDIEGLAARDGAVYVGLRGPVLRGFAVVLRLEPRQTGGTLELAQVGGSDECYAKCFLPAAGLGVRDLTFDGDDLLVLAGPTMVLEAPEEVFRWRQVAQVNRHTVVEAASFAALGELPPVDLGARTFDHAEGIAPYVESGERSFVVAYDAPSPDRLLGTSTALLDLVRP